MGAALQDNAIAYALALPPKGTLRTNVSPGATAVGCLLQLVLRIGADLTRMPHQRPTDPRVSELDVIDAAGGSGWRDRRPPTTGVELQVGADDESDNAVANKARRGHADCGKRP